MKPHSYVLEKERDKKKRTKRGNVRSEVINKIETQLLLTSTNAMCHTDRCGTRHQHVGC